MSEKLDVPIQDQMDILNKIIENNGACESENWTASMLRDCIKCPLSKLKFNDEGSPYSCYEAVGGHLKNTAEEVDEAYKNAALNSLIDLQIRQSLLEEDNNIDGSESKVEHI